MDRLDLVMELVFSNQQTFKAVSDFELCMLRRTSKIIQKNQNIMNAILKFRVCNAYDQLYFLVVDGCYATHRAYNEAQRKEAHAIFERAHDIRKNIAEKCKSDSAFRDCFYRLVMAEHEYSDDE
jgi:phosphomevalonate kinase